MASTPVRRRLRARALDILPLPMALLAAVGIALATRNPAAMVIGAVVLYQPQVAPTLREHSTLWLLTRQIARVTLLGVLLAMVWFARTRHVRFLTVMDLVAPCVPTGLAAGRLGNFINGELWGRLADPALPWGMVFRGAGDLPRHPSQLYQLVLEGLLLFIILWVYARKPRRTGEVSAVFLIGYGIFRFIAEYFREPDAHLGLLNLGLSMGQWLCVPMVLSGLWLMRWARR